MFGGHRKDEVKKVVLKLLTRANKGLGIMVGKLYVAKLILQHVKIEGLCRNNILDIRKAKLE